MKQLWVDKYKPASVDSYVFSDESQRTIINKWIAEQDLPHLSLFGSAGIGKTALADLLMKELNIHDYDYLKLNSSRFTSVDDIRSKVVGFAQMMPFASPFKVVLLDECLEENTLVVVLRDGIAQLIPINAVIDSTDLVKSFNETTNQIEWKSFQLFNKGVQDSILLSFSNGETVQCTLDHKWYTEGMQVVKASELKDHVITTDHTGILTKLDIVSIEVAEPVQVYDLSVEDNHNFFITDKKILTHNCDFLSINAQAALRGLIEEYSINARFIFTANYSNKVIPAIISRTQSFNILAPDKIEFTSRVATILINENVEFDLDQLDTFVEGTYPDLRKCINALQQNVVAGKLVVPATKDASSSEWRVQMVELFKQGKIQEARTVICTNATANEIEEIYPWIYNNLAIFTDDSTKQDSIVLIVKDAIVSSPAFADPEINLSACLIKIMRAINK